MGALAAPSRPAAAKAPVIAPHSLTGAASHSLRRTPVLVTPHAGGLFPGFVGEIWPFLAWCPQKRGPTRWHQPRRLTQFVCKIQSIYIRPTRPSKISAWRSRSSLYSPCIWTHRPTPYETAH